MCICQRFLHHQGIFIDWYSIILNIHLHFLDSFGLFWFMLLHSDVHEKQTITHAYFDLIRSNEIYCDVTWWSVSVGTQSELKLADRRNCLMWLCDFPCKNKKWNKKKHTHIIIIKEKLWFGNNNQTLSSFVSFFG